MSRRLVACVTAGILAAVWAGPPASAAQKGAKKPPKEAPPPEEGGGGEAGEGADVPPPADPGGGVAPAAGHGPADGFGHQATGGGGGAPKSVAANAGAISAAMKAGGNIQIAAGDVDCAFEQCQIKGNTTVDGGGVTLWFPGTNHNGRGVEVYGTNVIVRNMRIRNSGDCLGFGSAHSKGTSTVLVENVTVSASGDDGFSPAYDCKDITIRWSMAAGCARSCFFKYGGHNLTVHHSIFTKYWIRGPLCSGAEATIDFRNNLVEDWDEWGTRVESGAKGNFVNNTWRLQTGGGKKDAALFSMGGTFYSSGNVFVGCTGRDKGMSKTPVLEAPPVTEQDDAATSLQKVLSETAGAGCMPRDAVDKAYLATKQRPPHGEPAVGLLVPEAQHHKGGGN